jgi:hypothetical protein
VETNSTQPKAEMHATIGVNAQVAIGVAVACVWMIGVNRKLRTVNQNVITLGQALSFTNDGLGARARDGAHARPFDHGQQARGVLAHLLTFGVGVDEFGARDIDTPGDFGGVGFDFAGKLLEVLAHVPAHEGVGVAHGGAQALDTLAPRLLGVGLDLGQLLLRTGHVGVAGIATSVPALGFGQGVARIL